MIRTVGTAKGRKARVSKAPPAKKAAKTVRNAKPAFSADPAPLPDPLDEALAETFPASDPVAVGQSDRLGAPAPENGRGIVESILRRFWSRKR